MELLIKFLKRIHFFLLFILLEGVSLMFVVNSDAERSSTFLSSANWLSGKVYDFAWTYVGYMNLRDENEHLTEELAKMKSRSYQALIVDTMQFMYDSTIIRKYRYMPAIVLKNSINKENNFLTIGVGTKHGVKPDMGVVSTSGVVGVIVDVSENYSLAISLLNKKIGFSAKLKGSNFYGSVLWQGDDYKVAVLNEIPNHIELHQGDTIVTSGYSAIFPEGIIVGTIKDFEKNGDNNFYTIQLNLSVNMKNISQVFVIDNTMQAEQKELESHSDSYIE